MITGEEDFTGSVWIDDIKEWCQKNTFPIQNSPRSKQMETGSEIFVGHLRAFCPWIMMRMMMILFSHNLQASYQATQDPTMFIRMI